MPDLSMHDVFAIIDSRPEPEFVARLRDQVVAELERTHSMPRAPAPVGDSGSKELFDVITRREDGNVLRPLLGRPRDRTRRRQVLVVTMVAAIIAATVFGLTVADRHSVHRIEPATVSTTAPPSASNGSFAAHVSTELTIDDSVLRVDASVALPFAAESPNEPESPTDMLQTDVLMLPLISGTVTNQSEGEATKAVSLSGLTVHIFLREDVLACIVNRDGGCEASITRPQLGDGTSVRTGAPVTLSDGGDAVRTRVLRSDVSRVLGFVGDGTAVTGFAIVVTGASGATVTRTFDTAGDAVLSCSQTPADCLEASRSTLSTSQSSNPPVEPRDPGAPRPVPPGNIPPGIYSVDASTIGTFAINTVGDWIESDATPRLLYLARPGNPGTELVVFGQWLSAAPTPLQAVETACPADSVELGEAIPTELLGQPAMMIEGAVTADCAFELNRGRPPTAHAGDRIRVVAAEVNGVMAIIFAHAPAESWPAFGTELDTTIRSLTFATS